MLRDLRVRNPMLFKKIKKGWENIIKKERVYLGKKNCVAKEPYLQLVKERVKLIKMTFSVEMHVSPLDPKPTYIPIE